MTSSQQPPNNVPDPLAEAAIAPIQSGMTVGLGTGRAASRGILALASRARRERLSLRCVATSIESAALARSHGLEVIDLASVERIDYLFDGADEVDDRLGMLKGGHGAVVGERLAASVAEHCVYLVQREKLIARLGSTRAVPVIVLPRALGVVRAALKKLELGGEVRKTTADELFRADDEHLVIDVPIDTRTPEQMAEQLDRVCGIVDHGLFLDECDELLIEAPGSALERRVRAIR